tara:strand:- start:4120 stop:4971 length:852 start_codon:yes stop_codon:yes gene_type:complete
VKDSIFFSINICCYNSSKFLKETIDSVINQSFKEWELVIINDGSVDNTEKIILEYKTKGYPITYFYQKNKGYAFARNKAIELSKAEWIVILDHDDICEESRLINHYNEIKKLPNKKLFFGNCIYLNNLKNRIDKFTIFYNKFNINLTSLNLKKIISSNNLIKYGCFIASTTVVFSKKTSLEIKGFNENYKYISDYDFFFKFSLKEDLYCSNNIFCYWREHIDQSSHKNKIVMNLELNKFYMSLYSNNNLSLFTKINLFFIHFVLFIRIIYYYFKIKFNLFNIN